MHVDEGVAPLARCDLHRTPARVSVSVRGCVAGVSAPQFCAWAGRCVRGDASLPSADPWDWRQLLRSHACTHASRQLAGMQVAVAVAVGGQLAGTGFGQQFATTTGFGQR